MADVDISELVSGMEGWVTDGANAAVPDLADSLPVPVESGRLKGSAEFEFGSGFFWQGALSYNPTGDEGFEYASVVDDGASYPIVAVRKKALWWEGAAHPVYQVQWSTSNQGWFTDNVTDAAWADAVEANLGDLG